ncbi:MAG: hypothetical protein DLM64_06040 [Solirubrobacterales bacterium]|nr:MAG: hypothetical protein DLM64_06040 [Solirubrobacterales bacterium]
MLVGRSDLRSRPEIEIVSETATEQTSRLARDSFSVAQWTLFSRVSGFVRAAMVAAILGPSYLGNTFQATNTIPNLVFEFLTGSLLGTLLVPALVRHVDAHDARATKRVADNFLGLVLGGFGVMTIAGIASGPLIVKLLSLPVGSATVAHSQQHAGLILITLLMPQVLLYAIAGVGGAVMNAHGRFALAAAAPAFENAGVTATMLATAVIFGTGSSVGSVSTAELVLLGAGSTAAVAVHAAAQWWGAHRVGVTLVPRLGWRDAEVRALTRRIVPSLGYAGLNAFRQLAVMVIANAVPGGVVAFYLAQNFFYLPVQVGARPIALALLPRLARLFQAQRLQQFRAELTRGTAGICFLAIPAAIVYLVLARPLAEAVSFGQFAGPDGAPVLALALAGLAPGVLGEAGFVFATYVSYAQNDGHSPLVAMVWRTVISVAGMVAAPLLLSGRVVVLALAAAISVGDLVSAGQLGRRVQRRIPAAHGRLVPALARAFGASVLMVVPAYLIAIGLSALIPGSLRHIIGMLAGSIIGLTIYVAVQRAWRSPELDFLIKGLPRASRRR